MADHVYAIGIGSNRPLSHTLGPAALVRAAIADLARPPLKLLAASSVITSRPVGPSKRCYANAAAIIATPLPPPALLAHLQQLEATSGRRRHRRWGARTLDLDILLWSGGLWSDSSLAIPHVAFRDRCFVLKPLATIAPAWRDPVTHRTIRQLLARHAKAS